jgi:hypothetical protein
MSSLYDAASTCGWENEEAVSELKGFGIVGNVAMPCDEEEVCLELLVCMSLTLSGKGTLQLLQMLV